MKKRIYPIFLVVTTFFGVRCQQNDFDASTAKTVRSTPTPTPIQSQASTPAKDNDQTSQASVTPTPTLTSAPANCVDGDFVRFNYPPEIENCITQNKLFFFENGQCSAIPKAPYACTIENVKANWQSFGGDLSIFDNFEAKNGKLVGCGQSLDGRTNVAQWYFPEKQQQINCNYVPQIGMGMMTICTKKVSDPSAIISNPTNEQKKQIVLDCMMTP